MLGEINELEVKPSPHRGMTPRMFEFLFARIIAVIIRYLILRIFFYISVLSWKFTLFPYVQEEESRVDERLAYTCKCSFLEIYNEQITDLLDPSSTNLQVSLTRSNLECYSGYSNTLLLC